MLSVLIVFAIGFGGCLVMTKLHAPTPGLLGAVFAIAVFNFYSLVPPYPEPAVSFLSKVIIGLMLGRGVTRDSIAALRTSVAPTVFSAAWMIALSLFSGYVFHLTSGISLSSAMLGSAAGGISEMSIIALAMGADVAVVLFVQVFRFITIVMVTPFIAKAWANRHPHVRTESCAVSDRSGHFDYALIVIFAFAGGALGKWLGFPAGDMLGATVGAAAAVLSRGCAPQFPLRLRTAAQIGLGAAIAQNLTHDTIIVLGDIFLSLIVPTLILLLGTFVLVWIMMKFFGMDFVTSLLATSPGGLSQMVIMADELGADSLRIASMQLVRLLAIISILPHLINLITKM